MTAKDSDMAQEDPGKRRRATGGLLARLLLTALVVASLTAGIALGVQGTSAAGDVATGVVIDGVRVFQIEGPQWHFEPRVIRVSPGERVRFVVSSPDITHGFAINELGVNVPYSPGVDGILDVVIPLDSPEGTYTMYCSIFCGSGHSHMKGSVVVGGGGADAGRVLPFAATSLMAVIFVGFIFIARHDAQ